jgi:hypothetical protein
MSVVTSHKAVTGICMYRETFIRHFKIVNKWGLLIRESYERLSLKMCWSQWLCGLRRRSVAACLLGLRANPNGGTDVCLLWVCVGRERSLRRTDLLSRGVLPSLVCLTECDLETSKRRRPGPDLGCLGGGGEGLKMSLIHNPLLKLMFCILDYCYYFV